MENNNNINLQNPLNSITSSVEQTNNNNFNINKEKEKEKKIKVKDYVYNFDDEKIREYEKIRNDWDEDRKKYLNEVVKELGIVKNIFSYVFSYYTEKCRFLEDDIINLHFLILDLFNHYGFSELFKDMEEYKKKILENVKEEELAVNNKNKNLENLKNRIGLIYYLYENKKNNNITIKDVNEITRLVNEIMDITEFLITYFCFYDFYKYGVLKNIKVKQLNDFEEVKDLFEAFFYKKLLGDKFYLKTKQIEQRKLITNFHENFKTYLIDVYELLNYNVREIYDLLKKSNENINLIETEPEKIEEAFRKHVYLKDTKYAKLLDANKDPEYGDIQLKLKDLFFYHVGIKFDEIFN